VSADRKLGAAVVGTGFGVLTHVRALQAAGIEVKALVGRDADKASKRAELFGIPQATTSLSAALAVPGVDVVGVATPPYTHGPIVLEAVGAGKHVVCEKPFARDLGEARSMLSAAEEAGIVHLLGTEWRFATGQATLARAIAEGLIGEPLFALFLLQMPTLADPAAQIPSWWTDAAQGGGWLGAHGSHVIDQVRSSLGEFETVSASLQTLARDRAMTADDTYTVQFRLANGVEGIMHGSCATAGQFVVQTKVSGSAGSAWLQGDEVWVDDGSGARALPVPDDLAGPPPAPPPAELLVTAYDMWHSMGIDLHPYTRVYEVLRDRVLGRPVPADPVAATFADGVAVQAVMDAVHRSSVGRMSVEITPA